MIETHFDVYDEGVQNSLEELAAATGKAVGTIIRNRAPMLGRYLAEATQPIAGLDTTDPDGGSAKARDLGQAAVRRDLARVYIPSSRVYEELKSWSDAKTGRALARAFYKKMKEGKTEEARQILVRAGSRAQSLELRPWDGGARHKQVRNARGRVNKGNAPVVVDDFKSAKDYIKGKVKRVGFAKSGWTNAGKQIKSGGSVSAWIRNNAGPGRGQDLTKDTDHPRVLLTNQVKYVSSILTEGNRQRAVNAFERSLTKETQFALEYLAKKEEARANATVPKLRMAA